MREIPLPKGRVAYVDDSDYPQLCNSKWHAQEDGGILYAQRYLHPENEKRCFVRMHHVLVGKPLTRAFDVDHIDGNGLNNQRSNLRIVTHRENCQNVHIKKSSVYPGVCWSERDKKWRATITLRRKQKSLGYFPSELEAATRYRFACAVLEEVGGANHEF